MFYQACCIDAVVELFVKPVVLDTGIALARMSFAGCTLVHFARHVKTGSLNMVIVAAFTAFVTHLRTQNAAAFAILQHTAHIYTCIRFWIPLETLKTRFTCGRSSNSAVSAVFNEAFAVDTFVFLDIKPVVFDAFFALPRISLTDLTLINFAGQVKTLTLNFVEIVAELTEVTLPDA